MIVEVVDNRIGKVVVVEAIVVGTELVVVVVVGGSEVPGLFTKNNTARNASRMTTTIAIDCCPLVIH